MSYPPVLTTRIEARDGVITIALSGELDLATAPILEERLATLQQDGSSVVVLDIRTLDFIDSTGLHSLLQAYHRSKRDGHRLHVVGANPFTRRLFAITKTQFLLDGEH